VVSTAVGKRRACLIEVLYVFDRWVFSKLGIEWRGAQGACANYVLYRLRTYLHAVLEALLAPAYTVSTTSMKI
jgi:hypothetical protein